MKSQMKSASKSGARFAVIIGEDERAAGTATVRDLTAGEQSSVPIDGLASTIAGLLDP
jgi:histidyl-tRNA synthetase